LPIRGKSKLHRFKINVAFYDAEAKAHIVEDVVLSDKTELTEVIVPAGVDVKAVYCNEGQHGYCKVRFD